MTLKYFKCHACTQATKADVSASDPPFHPRCPSCERFMPATSEVEYAEVLKVSSHSEFHYVCQGCKSVAFFIIEPVSTVTCSICKGSMVKVLYKDYEKFRELKLDSFSLAFEATK